MQGISMVFNRLPLFRRATSVARTGLTHRYAVLGKIALEFAQPLDAIVKNRCGQRRVGTALAEHIKKRSRSVGAARSDHGNANRARNLRRERAIEPRARAVAVHGRD